MSDWLKVNSDSGQLEPTFASCCIASEENGNSEDVSQPVVWAMVLLWLRSQSSCFFAKLSALLQLGEQKPSNSCVRTHLGIQAQRTPSINDITTKMLPKPLVWRGLADLTLFKSFDSELPMHFDIVLSWSIIRHLFA